MFSFLAFATLGCLIRAEGQRISGNRGSAKFWLLLGIVDLLALLVWNYLDPTACQKPGLPNPVIWVVRLALSFCFPSH